MALRSSQIFYLSPHQLKSILSDGSKKVRLIDVRSFLEFNDNHIIGSVNICCSKLIKRRLQQEKISLRDLLTHCRIELDDTSDIVVYDGHSTSLDDFSPDSFIHVLLKKLTIIFDQVYLLSGGFLNFHLHYPEVCENKIWKYPGLSTLSQPCLPSSSNGPTRILPFLYLGSEEDAHNVEGLRNHNITYELNVSNKCPKPDFIPDGHFLRIPVNDSHNERLTPHFIQAFQFVDKVRESNASVLIHCLAGISRSPTIAIAYVMRHLQLTCEEAYRYVKAKRANISPNFNFLGQLLEYEKELISAKIVKKRMGDGPLNFSPSSSDYLLGCEGMSPTSSPPPAPPIKQPPPVCPLPCSSSSITTSCSSSVTGKKKSLSLRFSPFSTSPLTSPKETSPTSAMARLNFEKPHFGKENKTSSSLFGPFSSPLGLPNRLNKGESNVGMIAEEDSSTTTSNWGSMSSSISRSSHSISISKGFKSGRRSTLEQYTSCGTSEEGVGGAGNNFDSASTSSTMMGGNIKKCRIHKIILEGGESPVGGTGGGGEESDSRPSSHLNTSSAESNSWLTSPGQTKDPGLLRSDSVCTSGIGSDLSDHDVLTTSWDLGSSEGGSSDHDVFSEGQSRAKSPKPPRVLQLWSSDSGHWSVDEGISCSSSTIEIPSTSNVGKSPEKRKSGDSGSKGSSGILAPPRLNLRELDKRRSYAGGEGSSEPVWGDGLGPQHKRWSIAEDKGETSTHDTSGSWMSDLMNSERMRSAPNDEELLSWLYNSAEVQKKRTPTSDSDELNAALVRAHSCPILEGQLIHSYKVPATVHHHPSSEPIFSGQSSARMYKSRRSLGANLLGPSSSSSSSSFIDYDDLWWKLKRIKDGGGNSGVVDSSRSSSSSTLSSSSYSILVK